MRRKAASIFAISLALLVSEAGRPPRTADSTSVGTDARWEQRFGELMLFRMAHGHSNVPKGLQSNPGLAAWVCAQRFRLPGTRLPGASGSVADAQNDVASLSRGDSLRVASPYHLFLKASAKRIKEEGGKMKGGAMLKEIGEKWRGMSPEQRNRCAATHPSCIRKVAMPQPRSSALTLGCPIFQHSDA